MKLFRKIVFWSHLAAGIIAGVVIFIMSATGALLAFQPQIEEFAERDARVVSAPSENAARLTGKTLLERVLTGKPNIKPTALTVQAEPTAAAAVVLGREGTLYVNPYTGEITGESSKTVRGFFQVVTDWHRWIAASGEYRASGKAITGFCNAVFLMLAISGVYLWFPRKLSWKSVRAVGLMRFDLKGRARDFNWHNAAGFWSSLVLIVLTATALVISYQWANNLLYTLTGSEVPAPQQPQQPRPANNEDRVEKPFVVPANLDQLWQKATTRTAAWRSINLRFPANENAPFVFAIDEGTSWNRFGRSQLTLDAKTGEITKWEPYHEQNWGRKLRSWARFTHTGETGGIAGQTVAFLACLGGALLVWTGFSLSLRRFRAWSKRRAGNSTEVV